MKKPISTAAMLLLLGMLLLSAGCGKQEAEGNTSAFSGGTGTEADPYLLKTAEDVRALSKSLSPENWTMKMAAAHYRMENDIDMESVPMEPIGFSGGNFEDAGERKPFFGTFDGQNFRIKNLNIAHVEENGGSRERGLFALVLSRDEASPARIQNLILENPKMTVSGVSYSSGANQGMLIGAVGPQSSAGGTSPVFVSNCHVKNAEMLIEKQDGFAGGFMGGNYGGVISGCSFEGKITASVFGGGTGGFAGKNKGRIRSCETQVIYKRIPHGEEGRSGEFGAFVLENMGTGEPLEPDPEQKVRIEYCTASGIYLTPGDREENGKIRFAGRSNGFLLETCSFVTGFYEAASGGRIPIIPKNSLHIVGKPESAENYELAENGEQIEVLLFSINNREAARPVIPEGKPWQVLECYIKNTGEKAFYFDPEKVFLRQEDRRWTLSRTAPQNGFNPEKRVILPKKAIQATLIYETPENCKPYEVCFDSGSGIKILFDMPAS